jgi:hypothetical protein
MSRMTTNSAAHSRPYDDSDSGRPQPPQPRPRRDWQDLPIGRLSVPAGRAGSADPPAAAPRTRPAPVRRGPSPDPERYAHVPPLVATLVAGPMLAVGGLYALGSGMATDTCTSGGCQALNGSLVLGACLVAIALLALLTSWALPRHLLGARVGAAALAPFLALCALGVYFNLPAAT